MKIFRTLDNDYIDNDVKRRDHWSLEKQSDSVHRDCNINVKLN